MKNLITKSKNDEVFVVDIFENKIINIDYLIDAINRNEISYTMNEMNISLLLSYITSNKIDETFLINMEKSRRDEPIILATCWGETRIIDGNHRLKKRLKDGYDSCMVIFVPLDILESFFD